MKKILTIFVALCFANSAFAADVASWKIIPDQSKIEFSVAQDGTNITGAFKKFDGKINFDPKQLAQSKVTIEIDVTSVSASTGEASNSLQNPEWLSIKAFPKATFSAEKFSSRGGKNFRAEGNLTIKGKSVPTTLDFVFESSSPKKARATGKVKIKRSDFGVGNKDVSKANGVKDEVEVSFVINAER